MGDVVIGSNVGVRYPFGGLVVQRNFELGFGGSGRIGGQPVGFGNGYSNGVIGYPKDAPLSNYYSERRRNFGNKWCIN